MTGFYKEELKIRYKAFYPPFCNMLNIIFKGRYEDIVKQEADKIRKFLDKNFSGKIEIYGPVPAPRSRIKENYRYNMLLKSEHSNTLTEIAGLFQTLNKNKQINMAWDMNPQDLL